jgi:transcriptional regulator with XRE-family HTH domain
MYYVVCGLPTAKRDKTFMISAPNNIRKIRDRLGISAAQLAKMIGTSQQQITRLEKGQRRLSDFWLYRLAPALHCEPAELLASPYDEKVIPVPVVSPPTGYFKDVSQLVVQDFFYIQSILDTVLAMYYEDSAMGALIPAKSLVVINYEKRSAELLDKHFVLASIEGQGITIRRYNHQNKCLEALNDNTKIPVNFEKHSSTKLLGQLVGVFHNIGMM